MKKGNAIALLPIGVFLCIYLGLGIYSICDEIPMGFYNVPIHYRISCGNSGGVSAES